MRREVKFERGHNCIDFSCINDQPDCIPGEGGSHGVHGMEIRFLVHGEKGAVQFALSTGWAPYFQQADEIGSRWHSFDNRKVFPAMPTDLGYHSYEPHYEGQEPIASSCPYLGGKPCYYDGSSLNAYDAFYTLVNGGEDALWMFLEAYYGNVFEGKGYPRVVEYEKPRRCGV